ncbi:MAG: S8/S53 family peptidase [Desulfuromonadales bacterium]|nr:S8/S53 family peptidase [Desulfuromonadales bacterium]
MTALIMVVAAPAQARAPRVINDNERVVLSRDVHRLARPEFDRGAASPSLPMERMILSLRIPAERQAGMEKFLVEQQDPSSPNYHVWLTPEEFGQQFGPDPADIATVTGWLTSHGFTVHESAKGGTWINFSGRAADVKRAFHTEIHDFNVKGHTYHANATAPEIPLGLADLVSGVVSLHNFPRLSLIRAIKAIPPGAAQPEYTSGGGTHYLAPGDFATIYNVTPLYNAGIDGSGQSIAIVGRTHPASSNWSSFRSTYGLPPNPPQVIVNGIDPGDTGADEDGEADLDVEWSGAVARNATIKFVVSKSTNSTDGVDLSAQYIVNNNISPVMSTSFGSCESDMGAGENTFYNNLWSQAAAQGITSFVSTGDSGAAGCNTGSDISGSGPGVNGLSSTPYNVAVGGTQFNEGSGNYWNSSNGANGASVKSYIPEIAWNESGAAGSCPAGDTCANLWATGGGASSIYGKPAWQVAPGVPADGKRDLPDVSLNAAGGHDGYLVKTQGSTFVFGGTSASSPSFAGLMALIVQKTGQRQGNANVRFYQLAAAQYGPGVVTVFHDITSGNNSVPGVSGYAATTGYDRATGLGSVDANALATNWSEIVTPDFSVSATPTSLVSPQIGTASTTITTTITGGFNSAISLTATGLPSGVTASFSPAFIPAPGSGSTTLSFTATLAAPAGSYTIIVTCSGGSVTHTATVTLTIPSHPTLFVQIAGSGPGIGSGLVVSDTGGINCSSGGVGICRVPYSNNVPVTLNAITASGSAFTGWSGNCTGVAPCILAMTTDKNVTAQFGPGPNGTGPMAMLAANGYNSVNDAYSAAGAVATILAVAGNHTTGDLVLNQGKDVTLNGGYDSQFSSTSGQTSVLQGTLTIRSGSLRVNGVKVHE